MTTRDRLDRLYAAYNEAPAKDRAKVLAGIAGLLLAGRPAVPQPVRMGASSASVAG